MRKLWMLVAGGAVGVLYLIFRQKEPDSPKPIQGKEIERGLASYYGGTYQGRQTASGEIFDVNKMTAAHKTIKFGSMIQVIDLDTGNSVIVKINDRGPYIDGRIIDLSQGAAEQLGIVKKGVANVVLRQV